MSLTRRDPAPNHKLECSKCGTTVEAGCDCGVAYVPAGSRAAKALAANPKKSNRAIAAKIGVSRATVDRARKSTGSFEPVDERIGLDGKTRKPPEPSLNVDIRHPRRGDKSRIRHALFALWAALNIPMKTWLQVAREMEIKSAHVRSIADQLNELWHLMDAD